MKKLSSALWYIKHSWSLRDKILVGITLYLICCGTYNSFRFDRYDRVVFQQKLEHMRQETGIWGGIWFTTIQHYDTKYRKLHPLQ